MGFRRNGGECRYEIVVERDDSRRANWLRIQTGGEEIADAGDQFLRLIVMCPRIQTCRIAHGFLVLVGLRIQQQKTLPPLTRPAKTQGSIKNTALQWHVQSPQPGGSPPPDPTHTIAP